MISVQQMIDIIQQLTAIHEKLVEVSLQKTDHIKLSNTEKLAKLLTLEKQYMQELEQKEKEREQLVRAFFKEKDANTDEYTVSELFRVIEDEAEKQTLEQAVTSLVEVIVRLKESEHLNRSLLEQSMQFVHLSLDMLQPTTKNINYGANNQQRLANSKQSVFDSKV